MELEVLKKAITKVLQVYISEIQEDSTFEGDLGADSIDMMQIQKCVEDELGIIIKNANMENIKTVADALLCIKKSMGEGLGDCNE